MNESDIAAQVASRIPREPTVVAATQTTPVYQPQPVAPAAAEPKKKATDEIDIEDVPF